MAQIAFERILEQFIGNKLDIELVEIDLTAENRLVTNGQAVVDAIEALKKHGVGVKNAGMTVNRQQLAELLASHPDIDEAKLDKLATKSPNGAIRKGIGGNITREDIQFDNLQVQQPEWIGRDIEVDTMTSWRHQAQPTMSCPERPVWSNSCSSAPVVTRWNCIAALSTKVIHGFLRPMTLTKSLTRAHKFFQRAINEKRDAYLGLKDTVIPGYGWCDAGRH